MIGRLGSAHPAGAVARFRRIRTDGIPGTRPGRDAGKILDGNPQGIYKDDIAEVSPEQRLSALARPSDPQRERWTALQSPRPCPSFAPIPL